MSSKAASNLTEKQKRFCEEYLIDFNQGAAYVRAGYAVKNANTARSAASRLLTNVNIQTYLQEVRSRAAQKTGITPERVLEEISRVALSNITQVCEFDNEDVTLNRSKNLPDDVTAAIQSVSISEVMTEAGPNKKKSVKMHDKMKALVALSDFFGFRDDFNKARATLKRYGLALLPDESSDVAWRLERYAPDDSDPDA